jgi:hypothetical protein
MNECSSSIDIFRIIIITFLFLIVSEYGVDMKKIYPIWVIRLFEEPFARFVCYVLIYILTCYDYTVALLFSLIVLFAHIDYINLARVN